MRQLVRSSGLDSAHLVRSLPGVGVTLAPFFLALWPAIRAVRSRKALKAYVGFDLATSQSNRTLHTHGHMTKTGPSWARWALYLAADYVLILTTLTETVADATEILA